LNPVVTFDFTMFIALFAEFTPLGALLSEAYFMRATGSIISNSTTNPMYADGNLPYLIYLVTAHVAALNCPRDANGNPSASGLPASQLAGRISSATQGSVTVQTEYPVNDPTAQQAYLMQTKYGQEYLAARAPYNTGHYLARPTRIGPWR
jgi:Protein of unknown function (DUF4054)